MGEEAMEADGHAVSGDCVEDRGEDDVAEMDGMAPQERDGDRDGGDGRHDEQRCDDAAHNGGAEARR
jgi:hypothetical protein